MNRRTVLGLGVILSPINFHSLVLAQTAPAQRVLGAIASLDAASKSLTVKTDAGDVYTIKLSESTRMQKVAPGEKDLKSASVMTFDEMAQGDRAIIMGAVSAENKSVDATRLIVMTKGDITEQSGLITPLSRTKPGGACIV